ncbi:MAG TPA: NosD domain-containing protein, partial [Candidatus Saccharimonadales bacterium]|nr:NosD domain-containing protein [Candidatus Saccharimonadales bacterium]
MTNKSLLLTTGLMLVLLITSNTSDTFRSNTVMGQYYGDEYQAFIFDFVCDGDENAILSGSTADQPRNPADKDSSEPTSDNNKESDGPTAKPSGNPGKVIAPSPSPEPNVNQPRNPDDSISIDGSIENILCNESGGSSGPSVTTSTVTDKSSESSTPSLSCGQVISESVELTSNLECKADGILVNGDDLTVDLNGFTLTGPSQNSSKIGIMATNTDNVTIQGPGSISDFQAGVLVTSGHNTNVSLVDLTNNHVGAFISGSSDSTIADNRVTNNSIGVASYSSSNSDIETNLFESNSLAGTTLVESNNNNIYLNIVQDSLHGIFVDGQSNGNNVTYNNLDQDTQIGINNGNGLPTNINNNIYEYNSCNVSLPNGLCYGSEQPSSQPTQPTVSSTEQSENNEEIPSEEVSGNSSKSESAEESSASPRNSDEMINGLGSGNNVAVQSQNNDGSISAGQGTSDSGSSDSSTGSGSGSDSGSSDSSTGSGSGSDSGSSDSSTGSGSTTTGTGET